MQKKTKINWVLDPGKCLSRTDAVLLIKTAKLSAEKALAKGHRIAYRIKGRLKPATMGAFKTSHFEK